MALTYKDAGVDIDKAEEFVRLIGEKTRPHLKEWVLKGIGGFSSVVSIPSTFKDPLIVSSCDGVGSKLKIAQMLKKFDTVGIDLVAMCVNDLLPVGASPLFFLDYLGTGKLDLQRDLKLIEGIIRGCEEAQCALVGGETAELPGLYQEEDFELVGFAVGVVERERLIDGSAIREGDVLLGLSSSGLHSNGYSLVRKLIELHKLSLGSYFEELGTSLGEELLKPTKIYVKTVLNLLDRYPIKGMAHITGGGLPGNIPRILPQGLGVKIRSGWPIPPIFQFLQRLGVRPEEMWRVFNMGIGFVLVVDKEVVSSIIEEVDRLGEKAFLIGEVIKGKGVIIE